MWNEGTPLAVIADDLTGACDTACQFCPYGLQPIVTHFSRLDWNKSVQMLVVNSESRKQSMSEAFQQVYKISQQLVQGGRFPFYKKIDSTLKGNWCSELEALVKVCHPDVVLIAPAFPAWGRTTENGIQRLEGKPVSEMRLHLGSKKSEPEAGNSANLVEALQQHFGWGVRLIRRSPRGKGPQWIEQQIQSGRFKGDRFFVLDAIHDDDLKNIGLGGCRLDLNVVWVGSAGLARFLPLGWGYQSSKLSRAESLADSKGLVNRPVLLINGSFNPTNTTQLSHLAENRSVCAVSIEESDSENNDRTQTKLGLAWQALSGGIDVVLSLSLKNPVLSKAHLQEVHDLLQSFSIKLLDSKETGGLIIIGGDTAMKVYRKIGASGIKIMDEVQPGVPYGRWIGGSLDNQPIITKAGGFGRPDTLTQAVAFLRGSCNPTLHNREVP